METAAAHYHHHHHHHHAPAPLPNRARRNDSRTHIASAVRLRPNITKPIVNLNNNRFRDLRVFYLNTVMATKINQEPIKEENIKINEEEEEEEEQKSKKIVPPPPEKPEPDDCCGTGCVRCVWDVYFEELDAYNPDDSIENQN